MKFSYSRESYDFSNISEDAKLYFRLSLNPNVQKSYQSLNEYYCRHLKWQSGLQRLLETSRLERDSLQKALSEARTVPSRTRIEKQLSELSDRIAEIEKCYSIENAEIRTFQKAIGLYDTPAPDNLDR